MNSDLKKIIDVLKEKTRKTCCSIDIVDGVPGILDNKLGGQPYLPVGETYPIDRKHQPMALLLQVRCADINLPNYPDTGVLEIFTSTSLEAWPYTCSVKWYPEGCEYQTEFPEVDCSQGIFRQNVDSGKIGYKISIKHETVYMPLTDYRFDDLIIEVVRDITGKEIESSYDLEKVFPDEKNIYEVLFNGLENGNHLITIGGYADFTQEDPRPREFKNQDECLFKLDSCYDLKKINIGDAGIMCVFISEDEIKIRDFYMSNISWDCG